MENPNETSQFTFIWEIENILKCGTQMTEAISSPGFAADCTKTIKWNLFLYPQIENDKIGVSLNRWEGGPMYISIGYTLSFRGIDGSILSSIKIDKENFDQQQESTHGSLILEGVSLHPDLSTLTVLCHMWMPKELCKMQQCRSRTQIMFERNFCRGVIEDISEIDEQEEKSFQCENVTKACDTFIMKIRRIPQNCAQIGMFENKIKTSNYLNCCITFRDGRNDIIRIKTIKRWFRPTEHASGHYWGLMKWHRLCIHCSKKDKLCIDCDCTTVIVSNKILSYEAFPSEPIKSVEIALPIQTPTFPSVLAKRTSLMEDLYFLYADQILCDVCLNVGGKSFSTHKTILSARSPVFRAMFQGSMKERYSNNVDITDLDVLTVQQLLMYIYTDQVKDLNSNSAFKLYFAANKYQIESLKTICGDFIKSNLTVLNAHEAFAFADMHSDSELKKEVQSFIVLNHKEVISSDRWLAFMKDNIDLASEMMRVVCLQK